MTASRFKPTTKIRWAVAQTLNGVKKIVRPGEYQLTRHGYWDRGRGIKDVGDRARDNWTKCELEYRALMGFGENYVLSNYHQNRVYRRHVATI